MKCNIRWNVLTLEEWDARFKSIKCSNILQSYDYAIAHAKTYRQSARWGMIDIDGQEAGLVQIIEAKILWGVFHAVILDRGPLWFEGFGGAAHVQVFLKEFNAQFLLRFGRKRRILPEVADGMTALALIKQTGLKRHDDQTSYESLWWDLGLSDDEALQAMKSNWRGSLKKAEQKLDQGDIQIEWDYEGKFYPWLKLHYVTDKAARGYNGIAPKLLDNLAAISTSRPCIVIGKVSINGEAVAGVLFLTHGQTATYQIGWSSDEGRQVCAHHLLLWKAREALRNVNIKDIDLGGMNNEKSAAGIKKFKIGTGATPYKLVGQYE